MKRNLSKTKVSLVLSGLLLGSSLNAAVLTWTPNTAFSQTLTENSSLEVTGSNTVTGAPGFSVILVDGVFYRYD